MRNPANHQPHPRYRVQATDVRAQLFDWLGKCGWTWNQIPTAMREAGCSNVPSATKLREFAEGEGLHPDALLTVRRFITMHPQPGPHNAFMAWLKRDVADRIEAARIKPIAERIAREVERRDHVRHWLSREGKRVPKETGPLFGLDKETVRALRGY